MTSILDNVHAVHLHTSDGAHEDVVADDCDDNDDNDDVDFMSK